MISFRVGLCDLPDFFWHFWSLFLQIRICTGVLYPDSLVKPAMKNQGVRWPWVWGTIECGRALASTLLLQLLWWRDQPQECGICQESLILQVPSSSDNWKIRRVDVSSWAQHWCLAVLFLSLIDHEQSPLGAPFGMGGAFVRPVPAVSISCRIQHDLGWC